MKREEILERLEFLRLKADKYLYDNLEDYESVEHFEDTLYKKIKEMMKKREPELYKIYSPIVTYNIMSGPSVDFHRIQ